MPDHACVLQSTLDSESKYTHSSTHLAQTLADQNAMKVGLHIQLCIHAYRRLHYCWDSCHLPTDRQKTIQMLETSTKTNSHAINTLHYSALILRGTKGVETDILLIETLKFRFRQSVWRGKIRTKAELWKKKLILFKTVPLVLSI